MPTLPLDAVAATVDAAGHVFVVGRPLGADGEVAPDAEPPCLVMSLDDRLQPRWTVRLPNAMQGLVLLGGRLFACIDIDLCVALDPVTGAVLDADAPLLPKRMVADVDGCYLCDNGYRVMRVRPGLRGGENGETRFGFDEVPLFEMPPEPEGFFARLVSTSATMPPADATFPLPLGDGTFVAFEDRARSALVRFDRKGNKTLFAAISDELELDTIDDMQRAGDLVFLRDDSRLLLAHRGVVAPIATPDDLTAFAALPGGDLVLFGERVLLARRENGYQVDAESLDGGA
jgi:hypothetical protein